MPIQWSDAFATQVHMIDIQHQRLINLYNKLEQAVNEKANEQKIGSILIELVEYMKTHFLDEENLLKTTHYPLFAEHCQCHERFSLQIKEFIDRFFQKDERLIADIQAFLYTWIHEHIMKNDKSFSEHLKQHGIH